MVARIDMKKICLSLMKLSAACAILAGELASGADVDSAIVAAPASAGTNDSAESVIGPDYTDAPELTVKEGVPRGTLHEFTMDSADSKVYLGIAKNQTGTVPYKRKVCVYVPQQYVEGTPAPFIVVQ